MKQKLIELSNSKKPLLIITISCLVLVSAFLLILTAICFKYNFEARTQDSLINYVLDVFSLIIILILMYSVSRKIQIDGKINYSSLCFFILLLVNAVGAFTDFIAWAADDRKSLIVINLLDNTLYFMCGILCAYAFFIYIKSIANLDNSKKNLTKIITIIQQVILLVALTLHILNIPLGIYFTIDENGLYTRNNQTFIINTIPIGLTILLTFTYIILSKSNIKEKLILLSYCISPIIVGVFQIFYYGISLLPSVMTCLSVLIYTKIHIEKSIELNESKTREALFMELSTIDQLTGVSNRRQYEEALKDTTSETVGVLYTDVNGLKVVNDNQGHAKGDELIIRYTELLKSLFVRENIFRTGGDEFVVIVKNSSKESFDEAIKKFVTLVKTNNNITAYGYKFGDGKDIMVLLSQAEQDMYQNKSELKR